MTNEEFNKIVDDLRADGYEIDRPIKEAHGWTIGERARVLEDIDDEGIFEGDEGIVVCEEVGSKEYGNIGRIVTLAINSLDCTITVSPDNLEVA